MERKVAIQGCLFNLQSFALNKDRSYKIVYWLGEVDHSELQQIVINGFITLRSGDLEIIKVMDPHKHIYQ